MKYEGYRNFQVVDSCNISTQPFNNYHILEILSEDEQERAISSVPIQNPDGYSTSYCQEIIVPIKKIKFLVGKKEDDVITKQHTDIVKLHSKIKEFELNNADKNQKIEKLKVDILDIERERDRWKNDLKKVEEVNDVNADKNYKYERDMGKLISAFGELKIKEILGE